MFIKVIEFVQIIMRIVSLVTLNLLQKDYRSLRFYTSQAHFVGVLHMRANVKTSIVLQRQENMFHPQNHKKRRSCRNSLKYAMHKHIMHTCNENCMHLVYALLHDRQQ